ncbi:MAG TPA: endonuclease/exonuclease/phosphatase family protein [Solirubrobacterales bacterium]|nr:endonuclease/exonuclease/phosphatase family protein [Solirubrobacterales bacterium]
MNRISRDVRRLILLALAVPLALGLFAAGAAAKYGPGTQVNVMTRNLYLGADLTPAINAKNTNEFVQANGQILREVTANDFPVRAKGLAQEILKKKPDLVGLQEVAMWRTGPPSLEPLLSPAGPTATTVRYDYLTELLDRLNAGKKRYRVAVVQQEFDFEAPADENGVPNDGPNGFIKDAEINGRLTMRDVILVRLGAGVVTSHPQKGNFANMLTVQLQGVEVKVLRGWTAIDAKVRGSKKLRFVNTHLEAFDDSNQVPSIRALQAGELVAEGGPATTSLPVVLVGDLNSDGSTVEGGDRQAYQALVKAGMRERSTAKPPSCCIKSSLLAVGSGGSVADFDHHIDHVMTRDPKKVKLIASSVTGRQPVNGFWDSDHAGVFSSLWMLR